MFSFSSRISIIGINPYVILPLAVLEAIFAQAGRSTGPISVLGIIERERSAKTSLVNRANAIKPASFQ